MNGCIKTKEIVVLVQENGIIRNKNGRFLARLDDEIEFDGEHIIEKKMYSQEEMKANIHAFCIHNVIPEDNETFKSIADEWIKENL